MPWPARPPQQAGPAPPYDDNPHGALHLTGPSATAAGVSMCIYPALSGCNDPFGWWLMQSEIASTHACRDPVELGLEGCSALLEWQLTLQLLVATPRKAPSSCVVISISYQGVQSHFRSTS